MLHRPTRLRTLLKVAASAVALTLLTAVLLADRFMARGGEGWRSSGTPPATVAHRPAGGLSEVSTASELQQALTRGGEIRLRPGRYVGNFVVAVDGTKLSGSIDLQARRVSPEDVAAVVIAPEDRLEPPLEVTATDVTVTGLTVLNGAPDRETVVVGSQRARRAEDQPDRVVFDRVAVLAGSEGGLRGFSLHARAVTITRSHVAGFWYRGRDSQGIWANNGPGPYTIHDNYVEGSGENILFGGASIRIPDCVPSGVRITNNTISKPEAWRKLSGSVKNSVEFKAVRGALVEGNVIDGNWRDAQAGDTILLTPRNQENDTPWVVVEDVVIRGNRVQRARDGYAVNILGTDNRAPSRQTARVTIEHNLFVDARAGIKVIGGVADALIVRRNTFPAIATNWFLFSGSGPMTPLTVEANVARSGSYGISGTDTAVGVTSLRRFTTVVSFKGNVIEQTDARRIEWPRGNTLLAPGSLAKLLPPENYKHPEGTVGH